MMRFMELKPAMPPSLARQMEWEDTLQRLAEDKSDWRGAQHWAAQWRISRDRLDVIAVVSGSNVVTIVDRVEQFNAIRRSA